MDSGCANKLPIAEWGWNGQLTTCWQRAKQDRSGHKFSEHHDIQINISRVNLAYLALTQTSPTG
jgi:hypothetical protein